MRGIYYFLLLLSLAESVYGEDTAAVEKRIDEILRHPLIEGSEISIYAYNISRGIDIYQRNRDKLLNPASVTKLLTSAAALYYLGAHYRFPTEVYVNEFPDDNGLVKGDIWIKGYGDPRFINENIFNFILELRREGLSKIDGNVYLDTTYFDKEYFRPGWQKDIGIRAYYAPVSSLAVDFNSFIVYVRPASLEKESPIVFIEPPLKRYFKVKNEAITSTKGNTIDVDIRQQKNTLDVIIKGRIGVNQKGKRFNRRVEDPDSYAVEALRWFFDIHNIKVKGKFGVRELPAEGIKLFYTYYSDPLIIVLRDLNKHSNNFSADQLLKHLGGAIYGAPASFEKGLKVVDDFMAIVGIPKESYNITNGSGLSHENRISSDVVVKLLNYIYKNFQMMPDYISSLSIAAGDGTIRKRFLQTPCELRTRAKTGSIDGVASIAGYTTNSRSEVISFAMMVNGFEPKRYREITEIMDSVVVELSR